MNKELIEQLRTPGDEVFSTRQKTLIADALETELRTIENYKDVVEYEKRRREDAERKLAIAREALNNLASWGEGECVSGSFDEPVAAAVSRQALEQIGEK